MANKKNNLGDVSKKSESLRARSINSLHRSADDVVQQQNKRRMLASNQIQEASVSAETEKSYNGILKGLSDTVAHLSSGVKKITIDTSKATTDAIGQYGKAVGEDISINKTNTVAMALAQSTPLFGYFAAKFMETDVFKDSANRIKQNVGAAMQAGISKAGSAVGSVFGRGNKASSQAKDKPASVSDLSDLKTAMGKDIPKLQTGGYVKEGGIAELHAAEVVTPIDKLYRQFGEIVVLQKEQQTTISKIFVREFKESREQNNENQSKLINSFGELKAGIIGSADRTRVTWQTTLLEHPTFRNMMLMGEVLKTAIVSPIKWLFGIRGGYKGDVARAMSSSNMFLKQTNILALIYTKMMPKLDNIIQYTRASAEVALGRVIPPTTAKKSYTMYQKIKSALTSRSIPGQESSMLKDVTKKLGLDPGALKEAGITKLTDFLKAGKILRGMGFTVENLKGKYREDSDFEMIRKMPKTPRAMAKAAAEQTKSFYRTVRDALKDLVSLKNDQEEREKGHSPSMAEYIASTALVTIDEADENKIHRRKSFSLWFKMKKNSVMQTNYMKSMRTHLRKLKGRLWDMLIFGFGFLKSMFFKGIGFIKPALAAIGLGGVTTFAGRIKKGTKNLFGKAGKTKVGKGIGNVFGKAKSLVGLGKPANPYAKMLGEAGVKTGAKSGVKRGIVKGALKTGAKFAGRAVAGAAGGVIGMGTGMWDMVQAIRTGDAKGFVGGWLIKGISGFFGGTDSGISGAISGALKGGGIGAAATAITGPGALIGGAFGALAGGILGFIGGKNISKALKPVTEGLKNLGLAIWKPFKFIFWELPREIVKSIYILGNFTRKKVGGLIKKLWKKNPITKMLSVAVGNIIDGFKQMFTDLKNDIKRIGSFITESEMGKSLMGNLKNFGNAILNFPKYILQDTYKKLVAIPKIGGWIKKALDATGGFIKDVSSGELSAKLDKSLKYLDKTGGVKLPGEVKKQLDDQNTKDVTTRQSQTGGIILRDNIDKTIELKLEQKRNEELKKELAKITEGTNNNGHLMLQNIKNVSSSSNSSSSNTINNNGGGGGAMGSTYFSNAQRLAAEIALCNTQ